MQSYNPEAEVERFINEIRANNQWRKEEIEVIEKMLSESSNINDKAQFVLLRVYLPLLYAHWEGYVKNIFIELNKFLNTLNLEISKFRDEIITLFIIQTHGKLLEVEEFYKKNYSKTREFVSRVISYFQTQEKISLHEKSNTQSNLNYEVLQKLIDSYGMSSDNLTIANENSLSSIETIKKTLDGLLHKRNSIAHGAEMKPPGIEDVKNYKNFIYLLIDGLLNEIRSYLLQEAYLRPDPKR